MHGYQVIQELERRTDGRWRPSAGSVYPTLQLLEDERLVTSEELDGRRTYTLTDDGRKTAAEHPMTAAGGLDAEEPATARTSAARCESVAQASMQIQRIGTADAQKAAHDILVDARRRLYRLLADDEGEVTGQ